jgi:hypothetical protein
VKETKVPKLTVRFGGVVNNPTESTMRKIKSIKFANPIQAVFFPTNLNSLLPRTLEDQVHDKVLKM